MAAKGGFSNKKQNLQDWEEEESMGGGGGGVREGSPPEKTKDLFWICSSLPKVGRGGALSLMVHCLA